MLHGLLSRTVRSVSALASRHVSVATAGYAPRCRSHARLKAMSTPPGHGDDLISIGEKAYRSIREGRAKILVPAQISNTTKTSKNRTKNNDEGDQAVFYNPIQQFNRDLSILAILIYGESAILQKQERFRKKCEGFKRHNEKRRKQKEATSEENGEGLQPEEGNARKRKRNEDGEDDTVSLANGASKRRRDEDFEADGEELEVMELEAGSTFDSLHTPEELVKKKTNHNMPATNGLHRVEPRGAEPGQGSTGDVSNSEPGKLPKRNGTAFTILDALSATGLRALRYAKEIPFVTNVVANDLSKEAVKSIRMNVEHNAVDEIVHPNVHDARAYMYSKVGNEQQPLAGKYIHRFDVIDLDPYGTAAPFFDSALQALQDGGLLCVTCTDAGVFASNGYPEKAYAIYNGVTVKGPHSHEGGLRLILHAIATSAARYSIAIEPLLSLSIDFYARVFVRIHKKQQEVKLLSGTTMLTYNCDNGCGAWKSQLLARNASKENKNGATFFKYGYAQGPNATPHCEHCGHKTHLGGPLWAGPLHNPYFIQRILDRLPTLDKDIYGTIPRLEGMLTVALEEDLTLATSNAPGTPASEDEAIETASQAELCLSAIIPRLPPETLDRAPFFFVPSALCKVLHCIAMSEDALRGAIRHLGYKVTRSHCKAGSFKTTAPWPVIWEIFREWVRKHKPIKEGALQPGSSGWTIMGRTRGTDRAKAHDLKQDLLDKLVKIDSQEELRTVLESAMFRMQHTVVANGQDSNGEGNAETADEVAGADSEADGAGHDGARSPSQSLSKLNVIFDEKLGKEKPRGKLVRYQINPRVNWGPMSRAGKAPA